MWIQIFIFAWLALGTISAVHAICYKRDPRSATIWLLLSFLLPIVGPWSYWAFGINRVERRAIKLRGRRSRTRGPEIREINRPLGPGDERAIGHLRPLFDLSDRVTHMAMLPGNRLTPLHNGEEAYPEMLAAIASAEKNVTLASYIFDWDDTGRTFARVLGEAAQRGVKVHLLLDGIGAVGTVSRMGRMLIESGAKVAAFFPLGLPFGRFRMNLRNHRKILVVDGKVGFTGGMNVSSRHYLNSDNPNRAEDLHFKVEGPVVAELQETFIEDWFLATDEMLSDDGYFPELTRCGDALCRAIVSGPDEHFEKIPLILQGALAAAQESVWIVTPYFVPTSPLVSAMVTAALRGVRITLVLPSHLDIPFMRWASDAYLWQVLEHGVEVYHRPAPFVHTKLMIVDERWILLGSANMDRRSFRLNFEFNVEAFDHALARRLIGELEQTVQNLSPLTLEMVDSRPRWQRFRDGFFKLFSPHL